MGRNKLEKGERKEQIYVLVKGKHLKKLGGTKGIQAIVDNEVTRQVAAKKLEA